MDPEISINRYRLKDNNSLEITLNTKDNRIRLPNSFPVTVEKKEGDSWKTVYSKPSLQIITETEKEETVEYSIDLGELTIAKDNISGLFRVVVSTIDRGNIVKEFEVQE